MQVQVFDDGLAVVPESPQDRAFIDMLSNQQTEAGSMVVAKRINASPDHPDRLAYLLFATSSVLHNAPSFAIPPKAPEADAQEGHA